MSREPTTSARSKRIRLWKLTATTKKRFLEALPRYTNANEREIAIRRVITAFCKNVKDHVEKNTSLRRVIRG
ncbi:hypothetical protein F5879DRAFT_993633 [Lentinula edodes]|nr:hypothetical protein F5879DRAFT_993633 [Lentinula edodes]